MSTNNKNNAKIKPTEQKKLKEVAKKVAENHKGDPKPQLLFKKKDDVKKSEVKVELMKEQWHICNVYGVKFFIDGNIPTRRVQIEEVVSDHDLANEPETRNQLIQDAEDKLIGNGFFLTDREAMDQALYNIESNIDQIVHDIKFGCGRRDCIAARVRVGVDFLEYLRRWRGRRYELADAVGGESNLPAVIPNDYEVNWHVENNKLVQNVKPPKRRRIYKVTGANNNEEIIQAFKKIGMIIDDTVKIEIAKPASLPSKEPTK